MSRWPLVPQALNSAGEVDVDSRQQDLESNLHVAGLRSHRNHAEGRTEVILVAGNWHVGIGALVIKWVTEARASNDVFRILCDEGRRVISRTVGDFKNLFSTESFRADASHARRVVGIGEDPAAVVLALGL